MASAIDARPAEATGPWRSRVLTLACVLALLSLVFIGYSCLHQPDRSSYSAPVDRLSAEGVTYLANGGVYILARPDGSFLALDELDRIRDNRLNACVIRWRPDLQGGIFQEDPRCGGATFDREGASLAGGTGGLPMLRHSVKLAGKRVVVDIRQCIVPEDGTVKACQTLRY